MNNKVTLVTGLWDLGRENLDDFGRPWSEYVDRLQVLVSSIDADFIIYTDDDTLVTRLGESLPKHKRSFKIKHPSLDFPFTTQVKKIRRNPDWYKQADWLEKSPQAKLEHYNTVVMSKFFLLNDAAIENEFNNKYFFWIDAGLTRTVDVNLINNVKSLPKYMETIDKNFVFLSFPYQSDTEVHGFKANKFNEYCGQHSEFVCRGGFFGGTASDINMLNGEYYSILEQTLNEGYMGTEENIHTILAYRFKDMIEVYPLHEDGLVFRFFEHLSKFPYVDQSLVSIIPWEKRKTITDIKTSLYFLTYNSPKQLQCLLESIDSYDELMITEPRKVLIDNSTDFGTWNAYNDLCMQYGIEHIKKANNIGINGGRQFVAEHFMESDSEYYAFFEDDMFMSKEGQCSLGFNRYIDDFYLKSLTLMHHHRFDFLKFSFSEFFGDNSKQWAWHNVPENVKRKYFDKIDEIPDLPWDDRVRYKGLTVRVGNYYYCNWPAWFSRDGNQKIFLDTKWTYPHEQTWMSHVFQLQMHGKIKAGCLELSPINHDRFEHYPAEERVES